MIVRPPFSGFWAPGVDGGGPGGSSSLLYFSEPRIRPLGWLVNYGVSQTAASQLSGATLATSYGDLLSLVLFNEGAGVPFDLAIQRACTLAGAPTWKSNTEGWCGSSPSTTAYYYLTNVTFETAPSNQKGGNQVTICVIRRKTDTTLRVSSLFGLDTAVQTSQRCGAHVPFSDGVVYWDFGGATSPNRLTWSGYTPSTSIEKWVFVAGSRGSAIYFNGLLKASQSTGIGRGASNSLFAIGGGNGLGNPGAAEADLQEYVYFAMFDAQWNADQVAQWAANPYCFLQNPAYLRIP